MHRQVGELEQPVRMGSRRVPGPRAWPVVGDPALLRGPRDLIRFCEGYWHRYGDIFRVSLLGRSVIVLAHPNAIKHVLRTARYKYVDGSAYAGARRCMGDSAFSLEAEAWTGRRSLEQPVFHRESIEKLTRHMVASAAGYFDRLAARSRAGVVEIDAHRELASLTLGVAVRALFGQVLQRKLDSFDALTEVLERVSAGANRFALPAWVPTLGNRRWQRALALLDTRVHSTIDLARRESVDDSLLSMLIDARDERGALLDDRAIREEVVTQFIAGHETTALTLTWVLTLLSRRRDVLERMQREVDGVLGGRDPTFGDVSQLGYVRQVVDETLRLRPTAPMIARDVVALDSIHGYDVHAGEMVMPFFWATHRHPDFWADPLHFDPDRFDAARAKHSSWSYIPFSAGPRECIGNMFSLLETVVLLAQLLQRFVLDIEDCSDVKPLMMNTTRPSRPFRAWLRSRAG